VCREDFGDDGDTVTLLPADAMVDNKVERGAAPEVAPPRGEKDCLHGTLDGEEGDNDAEDLIGEAANEIKTRIVATARVNLACQRTLQFRLVPPPLLGYRSCYIILTPPRKKIYIRSKTHLLKKSTRTHLGPFIHESTVAIYMSLECKPFTDVNTSQNIL
jgi:hypothetical protein